MKRASLVAQWLGIRLPIQGTQVWALVWEDPTCCGATEPMCYNYWTCALEPTSHKYWAHVPQLLKPMRLEPVLLNKRSHRNEKPSPHTKSGPRLPQLEKAHAQQWRPNAAKNKWINKFIKKRIHEKRTGIWKYYLEVSLTIYMNLKVPIPLLLFFSYYFIIQTL